MIHALLSLFLLLAPPPDLQTWKENLLPEARMVVETPRELKSVAAPPETGVTQHFHWEMKYGFQILHVHYLKRTAAPGLTARQYIEAYGGGIIEKKPGARAEMNERTFLGKPGFDLKIIDKDKSGINVRTCMMRDGLEEWRWEVSYSPEFEKEEDIDHFINSIRPLPAPEIPALISQSPGPALTISLPGKVESKEQTLTDEQKKGAKSMTIHSLVLPDSTMFYLMHAEYQEGVKADLQTDFSGLLDYALSKSKEKDPPKIELIGIPNAVGYRTRARTWVDKVPATYRIATFTTGHQGWGIMMIAPNTVRHEKLLDDVFKSIQVAKPEAKP